MKRIFILALSFMFISISSHGQNNYDYKGGRDANTGLTRVAKNGKYGYIDDVGHEVIPLIYDEISDFGDGNRPAVVKKGGRYGYITTSGRLITEIKYFDAFSFDWDNRLAPVVQETRYGGIESGYIDLNGREVIPFRYKVAWEFSDGLAAVARNSDDKIGFINESGSLVIPYQYDNIKWGFFDGYVWVKKGRKWGMIDKEDKSVVPFEYDDIPLFDFYKGYANARKGGQIFYFDKQGRMFANAVEREKANNEVEQQQAIIEWTDFIEETNQSIYIVKAGIKSSSKVENVSISVDGQRGIIPVTANSYDIEVNQQIKLQEGPNKIRISVTNAAPFPAYSERIVVYKTQRTPQIIWKTERITTNEPTYRVLAEINSETKIQEVQILINDQKVLNRGVMVIPNTNSSMKIDKVVPLNEGVNVIRIFARNSAGGRTSENVKTVIYKKEQITIPTEKRLALVMGNAQYKNPANILKNPVNDARDIANKLKTLGFDTIVAYDKNRIEMLRIIKDFCKKSNDYQVALFFYAGHGEQDKDHKDFLIPVDAEAINESTDLHLYGINIREEIVDDMEQSQCPMKLLILDACRSTLTRGFRGGARGLNGIQAPAGLFVAYSTQPGMVALDGINSKNSPFATALLQSFDIKGLSLQDFFIK